MRWRSRGRPSIRIASAVDVLSNFEVETFLLYVIEDIPHRFVGPEVFQGHGLGKQALRQTMVRVLRHYLGGFEGRVEGRYFGDSFAILEWHCDARTPLGQVQEIEGIFVLHHEHDRITLIKGYLSQRGERAEGGSQHGEGKEIDEDSDHDGDS